MNTVEEIAQIRHAYYNEGKKIREIAREQHRSRATIRRALGQVDPKIYVLTRHKPAPVLDAWKPKIEAMLIESEGMPRKQRYTAQKIYSLLKADGYSGCITSVRNYVAQKRPPKGKQQEVFLPLAFDPGQDAQLDWGKAVVKMNGELVTVELFDMRLCFSRASFVCASPTQMGASPTQMGASPTQMGAYPTQRQEALFDGHVRAMHFFGGVTGTTTYDNMATVVAMNQTNGRGSGRNRERREQQAFTQFRSAYL